MATSEVNEDRGDLDTIARAFGLVVLQWGNAEQSLDMLIALLWQSFDTRAHARKLPMMLTPKLEYARKSFESVEDLRVLREEAEAVFAEFDRLSPLRNDLIHGAVASLAPVDGHFVLTKFDIRDGFHHVREVRVPIGAYPRLTRELMNLGKNAHELVDRVFRLVQMRDAESGR